jgi:hypothetical protein
MGWIGSTVGQMRSHFSMYFGQKTLIMKPVLETYMNMQDDSIKINLKRNSVGWLGHPGLKI